MELDVSVPKTGDVALIAPEVELARMKGVFVIFAFPILGESRVAEVARLRQTGL